MRGAVWSGAQSMRPKQDAGQLARERHCGDTFSAPLSDAKSPGRECVGLRVCASQYSPGALDQQRAQSGVASFG